MSIGYLKMSAPWKVRFFKEVSFVTNQEQFFILICSANEKERVRFLEIKFYLFSQIESALSQTGIQVEASGSENLDSFSQFQDFLD